MKICKFKPCNGLVKGKGYCAGHYWQLSDGRPLTEIDRNPKARYCEYEECDSVHYSKGYCRKHYLRFKKGILDKPIKVIPPSEHILSNRDTENMTADCAKCGPIAIVRSGRTYQCKTKRDEHLKRLKQYDKGSHGLTWNEARQFKNGKACAICGSTDKLVVDHCHKTMTIRGVLCNMCNRGLGFFHDDRERLIKAAAYLS